MGHSLKTISVSSPPVEITIRSAALRVTLAWRALARFCGHVSVTVPHFGIARTGKRTASLVRR
jgi:hypothetical protein